MRRDLTAPVPPASLPEGITLLSFDMDTARACRDLMNRVYAEGFGDPVEFDIWWPWLTGDADYDPRFMFVAAADGKVAGLCHCWTGAFIKDVVVDRTVRGRGVGGALVTMALLACKAIDAPYVDLKTDVDNFKAQSLYKSLGFGIVERVG
jgi:ribosomal protein S18 acetylase RimI-like enzyme